VSSTIILALLAAAAATLILYIWNNWEGLVGDYWMFVAISNIRAQRIFPIQRVPTKYLLQWYADFTHPDWEQALRETADPHYETTMHILTRETYLELKSRKAI